MKDFYAFLDKNGLQLVIKRHPHGNGTFVASLQTHEEADVKYRKFATSGFHFRSAPGDTPDMAVANLAGTLSGAQLEKWPARAAVIRGAKPETISVPRLRIAS